MTWNEAKSEAMRRWNGSGVLMSFAYWDAAGANVGYYSLIPSVPHPITRKRIMGTGEDFEAAFRAVRKP